MDSKAAVILTEAAVILMDSEAAVILLTVIIRMTVIIIILITDFHKYSYIEAPGHHTRRSQGVNSHDSALSCQVVYSINTKLSRSEEIAVYNILSPTATLPQIAHPFYLDNKSYTFNFGLYSPPYVEANIGVVGRPHFRLQHWKGLKGTV